MKKNIRRLQQQDNVPRSAAVTIKRKRRNGNGTRLQRGVKIAKALRESEAKYKTLFEFAKDAIFLADVQTGKIIDVNVAGCNLLGLPKEKIIGKHQSELHPPDLAEKYKQTFQDHVQKGIIIGEDMIVQRADGTQVPIDISASVVKLGDRTIIMGIFRDISERLKMAKALSESEKNLSKAFRAIPEAVSIATLKDGVLLEVNDNFLTLNGYSREEVIGHSAKELNMWVNPGDRYRMKQLMEKHGHFENEEFLLRRKSGDIRTVVLSADIINFEGQPCMLTIGNDITERKRIEEALRQSEAKYSSLVERSNDGIIIIENGILKFMNNKMAEMTGFTTEEAIGRKFIDFSAPEDKQRLMEIHMKRMAGEDVPTNYEATILGRDGHRISTEVNACLITYEGRPAVMAIIRDITERKRVEQALVDEAIRRRILVEQSRDGIVVLDQDGNVFEANQKFAEMLGYTPEEVRHLHVSDWEFLFPREKLTEMIRTVDEKGDHFETQHRRKDGTIYDVEISTNGAIFAGQKLIFCVCRDITERKQMEQALVDEATRRRILVEQSRDGIVVLDQDGNVFEANQKFAEMLGYSLEEACKLNIFDWSLPSPREPILELLRTVDEKGNHFETQHRRKDGSIYDVEISTNGAIFAGQKLIFCVCRDITERKRMEQALQESEEKFSKAFHASPEAIAITTVKEGRYIDVNESYLQRTGYSKEELIGKTTREIHIWANNDDRVVMFELLQKYGKVNNAEFNFRMKSGEIRTWLISMERINIKGEECHIGVSIDITERKRMEQALRESEEKFSKAFHASPQQIIITRDRDDVTVDVNDSFTRATGFTREETIGKTSKELGVWPKSEDNLRLQQMLKDKGRIFNEEFEFINKSGEKTTSLVCIEPVNIGGEKCWLSIVTDITERKKVEKALRESEERIAKAFQAIPEAISIASLEGDIFLEVNDSFISLSGYSREEIIGHTTNEIVHWVKPDDSERMKKLLEKRTSFKNEEFILRNKSGEAFTLLMSGDVINFGGKPCILVVANDITERKKIEQALRESEEKFSKAFHAMPEEVAISRISDHVFIDVNDAFCRNNGYTREEIIGQSGNTLNLTITKNQLNQVMEMVNERGRADNVEFEVVKKTGEKQTLMVSAEVININGEPCLLCIASDITERKKMEQTLRESEEKFSKAFHAMPEAVSIARLEDGTFIEVNDSFVSLNGYSKDEVIGRSGDDLDNWVYPSERDRMVNMVKKQGHAENIECEIKTKTGEIHTVLMSADIINIGGEPCMLCIASDITERKKMEQALRESEEKFSKAFHAIPETLSITTVKEGRFLDVNESFLRLNQVSREEVINRTGEEIGFLKPEDKRNKIRELLKKQNQFSNVEIEFEAKSGKRLTFLFSANTINIGGEPCRLIIGNDITVRKEAEINLQRALIDLEQSSALLKATNKELESFSYSVSHDLRSPLRSIDGFSQALLEDYSSKLDEKGQDYLKRLRTASQKMGELIDGLLKLSRLTRSEMHQEKVDLSSLANEIATRLQETHKNRVVKFIIDNDLTATGDPQMLRVLLENLLGNAFKFTKNTKQARIEFGSIVEGERKTFFIKDNGAGFDMVYKDKLFGAFQRLHDTAEYPGTGIGLATVQRIINRHGGSIRAEGEVGKGATFYFTLN